jgi:hypothetical protein
LAKVIARAQCGRSSLLAVLEAAVAFGHCWPLPSPTDLLVAQSVDRYNLTLTPYREAVNRSFKIL